jgi:hypothetical protein
MIEAANAAARAKGAYLRDKFYRLKARRGYKRAAVAIAHKILVAVHHMLLRNVSYQDLGDLYQQASPDPQPEVRVHDLCREISELVHQLRANEKREHDLAYSALQAQPTLPTWKTITSPSD